MTKKVITTIVFIAILIALLSALHFIPTFTMGQPGDANDPLVTRSYVDDRINRLNAEIAELRAIISDGNFTQRQMPQGPGVEMPPPIPGGNRPDFSMPYYIELRDAIIQHFASLYGPILDTALASGFPVHGVGEVVPFTPVQVLEGQMLFGHAGAEFILRSGIATALTGPDGMVNVTTGRDVMNGERIATNNLLLVPRTDGRGFAAETDTWVMIKGGFEIVD